MMSQSMPSNVGGMTALKVVKAIRHAQGRDEATQLRPIYRKGFPARKALKADVSCSRCSLILFSSYLINTLFFNAGTVWSGGSTGYIVRRIEFVHQECVVNTVQLYHYGSFSNSSGCSYYET
jgi:hypothetical protein